MLESPLRLDAGPGWALSFGRAMEDSLLMAKHIWHTVGPMNIQNAGRFHVEQNNETRFLSYRPGSAHFSLALGDRPHLQAIG